MKLLLNILVWFKNLFSKSGRKQNYFNAGLRNIKRSLKPKRKKIATKIKDYWKRRKFIKRFKAKRHAIRQVKFWQSGPKKSNYELMQLANYTGLMKKLIAAGVKTDWYRMKFLN